MYSVIIVDDEPWILKGLMKIVNWSKMGFEVTGAYTSSKEAWENMQNHMPDVVVTDISMPHYSGTDLLGMARKNNMKTEFVIISGYAEFSFAQSAVRYAAFDYCLKPLKPSDANDVFTRLKNYLDGKLSLHSACQTDKFDDDGESVDLNNKKFMEMINYIEENYHQRLHLNELAKKFYFNSNYCCYLFKQKLNTSFSDFVIDLRMKEVAQLLKDNTMDTSKAAKIVGYQDYYYFSKVFKKYFGITPMQYKKSMHLSRE